MYFTTYEVDGTSGYVHLGKLVHSAAAGGSVTYSRIRVREFCQATGCTAYSTAWAEDYVGAWAVPQTSNTNVAREFFYYAGKATSFFGDAVGADGGFVMTRTDAARHCYSTATIPDDDTAYDTESGSPWALTKLDGTAPASAPLVLGASNTVSGVDWTTLGPYISATRYELMADADPYSAPGSANPRALDSRTGGIYDPTFQADQLTDTVTNAKSETVNVI